MPWALTEMGTGVEVLPVALQRGAITRLGLVEFALLEINVPELRVMVRLVEVINLRLQFLDAAAILRAALAASASVIRLLARGARAARPRARERVGRAARRTQRRPAARRPRDAFYSGAPGAAPAGNQSACRAGRAGCGQGRREALGAQLTEGGEPRQLTSISTGADQPVWSPDGKTIGFVSAVHPEFSGKPFAESDRLNAEKDALRDTGKVKARIITQLLYRHWDSWVDDKRLHIFVVPAAGGAPRCWSS